MTPTPKGALLTALARSSNESERAQAHAAVRAAIARTGSTITAAHELEVSARWLQLLVKRAPALCQGLAVRRRGRPRRKTTDD